MTTSSPDAPQPRAQRAPRPRLVLRLSLAEKAVRRWVDARAGEAGVGMAGAGALFTLEQQGSASISQVAGAIHASPAAATGLIQRLEKAGLILRSPDPKDARASLLTLTDDGKTAAQRAHRIVDELNAGITHGFTPDELQLVARWLEHCATVLDRP